MLGLLATVASVGLSLLVSAYAFKLTRSYFTRRLRYVDVAHSRLAPIVVGSAAALLALPFAALPLVGTATAVVLGFSVGLGVASASREVRVASYHIDR